MVFNSKSTQIQPLDSQRDDSVTTKIKLPFSMSIVASKNSGKSTLLLNLLLKDAFLKNQFNRCIYFSPTATLDAKTNVLKENDFLKPNIELYKLLKKLEKKKKQSIMGEEYETISIEDFPKRMTDEDFQDELDVDFINGLIEEQKHVIKKYGKKYCDKLLLIIDDFASAKILKSPYFKKIIFNSRHYNISTIITSQSYFQIEKSVRLNASLVLLYETGNSVEIKAMYDENHAGIDYKKWLDMYNYCISKPYNFLTINYQQSKKYRLMDGLNSFLQ